MKTVNIIKRMACYLLGLFTIALGINFAKMSMLGISPVSSIPRACEVIFGDKSELVTLGNMTIVVYCILVLLQIVVLRKKFKPYNILGIAVAIIFGKMVDFAGYSEKTHFHLLLNLYNKINPAEQPYLVRLALLLSSTIIIAIGVFLYLRPKFVPMPAEGLAGAISTSTGKVFGNCKTIVDCSMIAIAFILQFIFLGGINSFTGDIVVVREGTIISAVVIGQIVKFLSKKLGKYLDKFLGIEQSK